MREFLFAVGKFVKEEFDKLVLVGLVIYLFPHLQPEANSQEFIKECITGALGILYGFLKGQASRPDQTKP